MIAARSGVCTLETQLLHQHKILESALNASRGAFDSGLSIAFYYMYGFIICMFDNFLIYGNAFFGERICEFLGVEEEQRGSASAKIYAFVC